MLCWYYVLICLQRVMKLVSWMTCWRRCSLELLSGEREDHGKQVLTHKHSKSSQNLQMFQGAMSVLIYRLLFPFTHTFMVYIQYWSTWSIWGSFVPSPCFFLPLSKHNNRFVCVLLSLSHLLHGSETVIVVVVFGHGYGGQSQLHQCLAQQQDEREGAMGWCGQRDEEQLVRVWLWSWKIQEEYDWMEDKPECG